MEEYVALDSSKQKQFIKSIKGIKKILKGKSKAEGKQTKDEIQIGKVKKPKFKRRGLVYLSHIPHGFYEHQMTEYFKQFGVVTNARVIRSKRTGMSKGHAFVEFKDPNVAEIVAETMNNYLMGKRLIKAAIIPPEKQRKFAKRKHWNAQNNPGNDLRQKMKKAHNSIKDEKEDLKIAQRLLSNLNRTKKKLLELDINYDFFTPVDIPESLLNLATVKTEEDVKTEVIKEENKLSNKVKEEKNTEKSKKKNKEKKSTDSDVKAATLPKQADNSAGKKSKKSIQNQQPDDKIKLAKAKDNTKNTKVLNAEKNSVKGLTVKEEKKVDTKDKASKTQKQKEKKLKDAGVKPPENFIKINNESEDESDSSLDFDSDEFDKVMEQGDSDVGSDDSSDEDLDEDITSEEDASAENVSSPIKKVNIAPNVKIAKPKSVKKLNPVKLPTPSMKRMPQKDAKASKKTKFEKKGNKKTINKVIKKKK